MNQEIILDFQVVETNNPKKLLIGDFSQWEYAQDLPAYVFITLPATKKKLQFTWKKDAVNYFNSNNLGVTCLETCITEQGVNYSDLNDGVYTIELQSGFADISKTEYYLKTDIFNLTLSKIIIERSLEYKSKNDEFIDNIYKLKYEIEEAKSYAIEGNFVEAQRYYSSASEKLKDMQECITCN